MFWQHHIINRLRCHLRFACKNIFIAALYTFRFPCPYLSICLTLSPSTSLHLSHLLPSSPAQDMPMHTLSRTRTHMQSANQSFRQRRHTDTCRAQTVNSLWLLGVAKSFAVIGRNGSALEPRFKDTGEGGKTGGGGWHDNSYQDHCCSNKHIRPQIALTKEKSMPLYHYCVNRSRRINRRN